MSGWRAGRCVVIVLRPMYTPHTPLDDGGKLSSGFVLFYVLTSLTTIERHLDGYLR